MPWIAIVRNPYIRLLSGYLEKLGGDWFLPYCDGSLLDGMELNCDKNLAKYVRRHVPKNFKDFVYMLKKIKDKVGDFSRANAVNRHFALQTTYCGFEYGAKYDYFLKLENIDTWYPHLVADLHLEPLVSSGWPDAKHCFLSTTQAPCKGPFVQKDPWGGITFHAHGEDAKHTTGSADKVRDMYTPEIVAIVNEVYADDFEMFGYQVWNGEGEPRLD